MSLTCAVGIMTVANAKSGTGKQLKKRCNARDAPIWELWFDAEIQYFLYAYLLMSLPMHKLL